MVVEPSCLILREDNHSAGLLRESLEHLWLPFCRAWPRSALGAYVHSYLAGGYVRGALDQVGDPLHDPPFCLGR